MINISRLIQTMAILMRSGVHLLNSVAISSRVISNTVIRDSISDVASKLRHGEKLSSALSTSDYIPKIVINMLNVGEETGNVEEMLERVSNRYEEDIKRRVKGLLSLFEPMVIITLGAVVAYIVVSMFLFIFKMNQQI